MTDLIADHLAALRRARYSDAAIAGRERVLRSLPDPLLSPKREPMQEWWATRQTRADGRPRAASSLSQDASHVRSFYRWAMTQGHCERNGADWLPRTRQRHPAASPVSEKDLLRAMEEAPDPMRRALALGAMAGLRSAEIAAIQWADLDRGNGVLWVREGKGSKGRTVPLSAGLLGELGEPGDGPIIGRRATPKAVSQSIGRYLRSCGVNLTAHKLRARYATRFLAATGDLAAAAEALGHADLSSIGRYVVASSDVMRRGAEAAGRIG
jgi:integrase